MFISPLTCSSTRTGKLNDSLTGFASWTNQTLASMANTVAMLNPSMVPSNSNSNSSNTAELWQNLSQLVAFSENKTQVQ